MLPVRNYTSHFIHLWEESPDFFPGFTPEYTADQQTEKEIIFENFYRKINSIGKVSSQTLTRMEDPSAKFFPVFRSFLQQVFGYPEEQLRIILSDEFRNVSRDFFYQARRFGPELTPANIYQGLRNVWIMNGIQLMLGLPVEITPSVFAYSMIYPYSDNFLDNPGITSAEKQRFSERFDRKLHGENPDPEGLTESRLYKLVDMFGEQFPRKYFPSVYNSLYAIQEAQTKSLELTSLNTRAEDTLRVCFEKGGTSVLADGYLVAGTLTPEQEEALFGYGVYLQLLDDIQDVDEDFQAGTNTLFVNRMNHSCDKLLGKTIHFGRKTLEKMKVFPCENREVFLQLMNKSIENMIIESAGLNFRCFSPDFLNNLERYSPLCFEFIRKKKSQGGSQRFAMFRKYFEQHSQPAHSF